MFKITRQEYVNFIVNLKGLNEKEAVIINKMIELNTVDRNKIAEALDMNLKVVSNYKSKLKKNLLINDKEVNKIFNLNKIVIDVSNT